VQTVPLVPWSHPFAERLIRSVRAEYLDELVYWNGEDLKAKLDLFTWYRNEARAPQGLDGDTPAEKAGAPGPPLAKLDHYSCQSHCHGLVRLPIAA